MPVIKVDHIVSFSSEDPQHVCTNILSSDTSKKWKCRSPGEKTAVVVLQLEKACVITGIDIGNEHSAYIEVLVSRSGTTDDYKVLLVTSAFMTPLEARQSLNVNKVRMFVKDQFSKPENDEKWDRIKIVCTQPFNKHVQYGLSFIKLHSNSNDTNTTVQRNIGKFTERPESPDSFSAGSLFNKRKELKLDESLTGAAAIRDAMREAVSPICKPKLKNNQQSTKKVYIEHSEEISNAKPRNRNEILYSKDEEEPNQRIDKIIQKKDEETKEKQKLCKDLNTRPKKERKEPSRPSITEDMYVPSSNTKKDQENGEQKLSDISITVNEEKDIKLKRRHKNTSRERDSKKFKKDLQSKPFAHLLDDVVLVISGIQNPDRANLRTHALSMGAKYKSDWDNTCTHLVCAFINTPKFNQVKGNGKIVKRMWIEDCYSQRKRLPWRRYALDRNDAGEESEEEICETINSNSSLELSSDTDIDNEHMEKGSDTEEKIASILDKAKNENNIYSSDNIYEADTDEEDLELNTIIK